ncbi:BnaC06g14400D [Brassica napus]|uniref:(rape) hypothetical protein n=1 Tax=Brassica napus TaxID=3708 RepID=A0A078FJY0_BRANA|nr:unnamed protein product [Brassica napus]CDY13317.1 BnaC06g14400D [Brassica napus]
MGKMQKNGSGVHGNDGFSETEPRDHALNGQQVAQTEETQVRAC